MTWMWWWNKLKYSLSVSHHMWNPVGVPDRSSAEKSCKGQKIWISEYKPVVDVVVLLQDMWLNVKRTDFGAQGGHRFGKDIPQTRFRLPVLPTSLYKQLYVLTIRSQSLQSQQSKRIKSYAAVIVLGSTTPTTHRFVINVLAKVSCSIRATPTASVIRRHLIWMRYCCAFRPHTKVVLYHY